MLNNFFTFNFKDAKFKFAKLENVPNFARDILVCTYNEICKKYHYPEFTKYFYKSNDITYSLMHEKLT